LEPLAGRDAASPGPPAEPAGFSGSWRPQDAIFLLKVVELPATDLEERERRIQSGESHYSEMIGPEEPPTEEYLAFFRQAFERNVDRLAADLAKLAVLVDRVYAGPLTLVSIARSGTPVGVLLKRTLALTRGREAAHYSISVIRDQGVDHNALRRILGPEGRRPESLIFVDGWTGKGVIARELTMSLVAFNRREGRDLAPNLAVLTDLCGRARLAAGADDYLIPSSLLNSVVSGLISRTIFNRDPVGPDDFHGCLFYEHLAFCDLSNWFVEAVMERLKADQGRLSAEAERAQPLTAAARVDLGRVSRDFLYEAYRRWGVKDENLVKPGLGEATRVLLRRKPALLAVRDLNDPDAAHALGLAARRGTPVVEAPDMPYRAAAVIAALTPQELRRLRRGRETASRLTPWSRFEL
jgi:hypothetical protein